MSNLTFMLYCYPVSNLSQSSGILFHLLSRHTSASWWFTSAVMPATMEAWRKNPSEFMRTTKARTSLRDIDLKEAISTGYASVRHEDGYRSVWIFLKAGPDYDLL